jgi:cytochrome oxidase Cu insertion factor (SCO1/SenC/PrrC family)
VGQWQQGWARPGRSAVAVAVAVAVAAVAAVGPVVGVVVAVVASASRAFAADDTDPAKIYSESKVSETYGEGTPLPVPKSWLASSAVSAVRA